MPQPTYTGAQIAVAARELREAAGADDASSTPVAEDKNFTLIEALRMLGPEIILLRERGFSDESIADLLTGFDIEVSGDQLGSVAGSIQPRS